MATKTSEKLNDSRMKTTQYNPLFVFVYTSILVIMLILVFKFAIPEPTLSLIFRVVFILFLSIALCYYKLTISINEEYVAFSLGIGLIKKKYLLSKFKKCEPVKGKFSIYSRFCFETLPNGGKSYVLSSALPSIELTYENENGIIMSDRVGTAKPEEIADYINKIISRNFYLQNQNLQFRKRDE